jgi:hypothetical protein
MTTVEASMKAIPWVGVDKTTFFKGLSGDRLNQSLDASSTAQVVFADVAYGLKPDYSGVGVTWTVSILNKDPPAGQQKSDRLATKNFAFSRSFLCVSPARGAHSDPSSYVQAWSTNGGQPLRDGVARCMSALGGLITRNLTLTPAAAEAQQKALESQYSEVVDAYVGTAYTGKVIERSPTGTLFVDKSRRWILALPPPQS